MPDPKVVDPAVPVVEENLDGIVTDVTAEETTGKVVVPPVKTVVEPVVEEVVEEPVVEEVPVVTTPLVSKEEVQKRIDRMYARLMSERGRRTTVETDYNTLKRRITVDPDTGEEVVEPKVGLSQAEAEAIWDRKENERKFKESETKVLLRHPDALNPDGSFNMDSPFTKMYVDIGRQNQSLCFMQNGPELAEAMVEKQLGPQRVVKPVVNKTTGAVTATSTVSVPATRITQLPDFKKKIAARMGMTEADYMSYEAKIKKGDHRVGSTPRT